MKAFINLTRPEVFVPFLGIGWNCSQ